MESGRKNRLSLLTRDFTEQVCCELLPEWQGCRIDIIELHGGNTNRLYRAKCEKGDYSIRIYGDKTELYINRDDEVDAISKTAELGIGPALIKYLPDQGVTIVKYIDHGITLNNKHFLDVSLYHRLAEPIRKMHSAKARLRKTFNPLIEVTRMAELLQDSLGVHYAEFDIAGVLRQLEKLDRHLQIPETAYALCHNDLVAENFILMDAGFTDLYGGSVFIIDWEYAGMSPRYYDLADLFQEVLLPRENEQLFVDAYEKDGDARQTLYYIDLYKPYPDLYWFLWSLVQKQISGKQFDFYSYGKVKYENALKSLTFLRQEYKLAI
jgi:thiamine kinase-like enzyme